MKKLVLCVVFLSVAAMTALVVLFERYPSSAPARFIEPWCFDRYVVAREKVIDLIYLIRSRLSSDTAAAGDSAESDLPPSKRRKAVKAILVTPAATAKAAPPPLSKKTLEESLSDESAAKELEKMSLSDAKWYSKRRLSARELKGKIVICCVWNSKDPASFDLLRNAQRISDGFRGKPLIVFASHRGGETPAVRKILDKDDIVIPCCEGAGHPSEPRSVSSRPVFYMLDKTGKLVYYGRNDKTMTVKLVDLLSM